MRDVHCAHGLERLGSVVASPAKEHSADPRREARKVQRQVESLRLLKHHRIALVLAAAAGAAAAPIDMALETVDRWERDHLCSPEYVQRWRQWLARPAGELVVLITSTDDPWALAMRQNSPFHASTRRYTLHPSEILEDSALTWFEDRSALAEVSDLCARFGRGFRTESHFISVQAFTSDVSMARCLAGPRARGKQNAARQARPRRSSTKWNAAKARPDHSGPGISISAPRTLRLRKVAGRVKDRELVGACEHPVEDDQVDAPWLGD